MKIIIKLYILSCFQKKDGNIYTKSEFRVHTNWLADWSMNILSKQWLIDRIDLPKTIVE